MRKLIFILIFFPLFSLGQDSLKIRAILEKSVQIMNTPYNSIEYTLRETNSFELEKNIISKVLFDSNNNPFKVLININIDEKKGKTENEFNTITFADISTDIIKKWYPTLNILYYYSQKDFDYLYLMYNYFNLNINDIDYLIFNPEDSTEITIRKTKLIKENITLNFNGIRIVNGKPSYVIEYKYVFPDSDIYAFGTYNYPDKKDSTYVAISDNRQFYIDTASYIPNQVISYTYTQTGDTIFYTKTELLDYKINTFTDITFNPENAQKIQWLGPPAANNDTCANRFIKDLQGKAPNIIGADADNKPYNLYSQKAKCYIIDFMYSGCGVCFAYSLPYWDSLSQLYNNPDIQYILVDPIDNLETIKKIQDKGLLIPIISDKKANKNYSVKSYPVFYILDENFNIIMSGTMPNACQKIEIRNILSSYHNKTNKKQ